jgi:hypothetical protein
MTNQDGRDQADRGFIEWTPRSDSALMVQQILSQIQIYRDQGVPAPTVRDVMYEVRARFGYKKTDAFKRKVYRLLSKMRRVKSGPYKIGFNEIDDDSPTSARAGGYHSPAGFWRGVEMHAKYYSRNLSDGQPYRVIVLTEGAGKVRQFYTVTGQYGIPVYSGGGWESIKLKHDLAKDAADEYRRKGRPTLALHCGDFDADGAGIFEAGIADVRAFIAGFLPDEDAEEVLQVERLMLTQEQAAELADEDKDFIDRSQIKKKDHRGLQWYDAMAAQGIRPFKCELEVLSLRDRLDMLRERIEEIVDHGGLREGGAGDGDRDSHISRRFLGSAVRRA